MHREIALKKIIHFCTYRERSRQEVCERLNEWDVEENLYPSILQELEKSNFINEGRFAREYAHGKFKINSWGRIRIRQGLFRKGVSEDLIEKALRGIDETEYHKKLNYLIDKKLEIEDRTGGPEKFEKVARYVLSHGFESELVWKKLNQEPVKV